eukprot:gene2447-21007_t
MLGLLKRVITDRRWDLWEEVHPDTKGVLPHNVTFVGAVNPHQQDLEEGGRGADAGRDKQGFDVKPMPPSLKDHCIPWRQLEESQRDVFIARRLGANKNLFQAHVPRNQVEALCSILILSHKWVAKYFVETKNRATLSQRDINRAMSCFDLFFTRNEDFVTNKVGRKPLKTWHRVLSAMLLGIGVSYYYRLPADQRHNYQEKITEDLERLRNESVQKREGKHEITALPQDVTFADVLLYAVNEYTRHYTIKEGIHTHQGLRENLFVQMCCFHQRIA